MKQIVRDYDPVYRVLHFARYEMGAHHGDLDAGVAEESLNGVYEFPRRTHYAARGG